MSAVRAAIGRLQRQGRGALPLLALWWALVVAQALVPRGSPLGREDLGPWCALTLGLAALLRGRSIGDGPHPMLRVRRARGEGLLRRVGAALSPAALLLWRDAGAGGALETLGLAAGLTALAALLLLLGRADGATAWDPQEGGGLGPLALMLGAPALAFGLGALLPASAQLPLLCGLGFGVVSLCLGRPQHSAQRRAAGRRDGRPWRRAAFPWLLALAGPSGVLALLLRLSEPLFGAPGFSLAMLASLCLCAWAAVIWPPPRVVARHCLLHEVVPAGGHDAPSEQGARAFDAPPEGALRLDPLSVRRTRQIHPWLVPVLDPRIGELDDPVRPLWDRDPQPLSSHVLGDAAFLPDPRTRAPQEERITVTVRGNRETTALRGGEVQTRRVVVLRAFPPPGGSRAGTPRTWRWERRVPAASLQVMDARTATLELMHGDILVLSSEGVARAFELEIGEAVRAGEEPQPPRPPQLEDYCEVGS